MNLLLESNNLLNVNSRLHSDHDGVFSSTPSFADFIRKSLGVCGKVKVSLLVARLVHESKFITINIDNFPLGTVDNGDSGTMGRRNHIFILFSSENVSGSKVTLGMTVLSSLGDGNVENLAGMSLDHHVSEKGEEKVVKILLVIFMCQETKPLVRPRCMSRQTNVALALHPSLNYFQKSHMVTRRNSTGFHDEMVLFLCKVTTISLPSLFNLTSLHRNGGGGTGICRFNCVICVVRHGQRSLQKSERQSTTSLWRSRATIIEDMSQCYQPFVSDARIEFERPLLHSPVSTQEQNQASRSGKATLSGYLTSFCVKQGGEREKGYASQVVNIT